MRRNLGMVLLAVYLILVGFFALVPLGIPGIGNLLALLAIVTGILILIGK
jgi:hypothetical protein